MAEKKTAARGGVPTAAKEPTKAQLQRRMEKAREDISQTVEEIKDTVTESYESVKETVSDALDWREQFRKHSIAWSLGALAVGYIVGNGLAASLQDATPKKKGRKSSGLFDEVYAFGERLSDELSDVAQTVLLPALSKKVKETFGINLSERLLASAPKKRTSSPAKRATKKSSAKKAGGKKSGAKKHPSAKRATKKST